MKPETAAAFGGAIGLSLVVGLGTGYLAAGEPITRTPSACHSMATKADETFDVWTDLTGAVKDRGDALDKETYAIHDAEVNHLLASLDVVAAKYKAAESRCLGADR